MAARARPATKIAPNTRRTGRKTQFQPRKNRLLIVTGVCQRGRSERQFSLTGRLDWFEQHWIALANNTALDDRSISANPRLVVLNRGLQYPGILGQVALRQRGHHAPSTRAGDLYFYFAAD